MRAAISLVAAICVASGGAAAYAPGGRAAPFSPPQRSALAGDGSVPASPAPTVHEPGPARLRPGASLAVAAALLGASLLGPAAPAALAAPPPALASSPVAAQIDIDSVPPKNIVIDIADLPVIGPLLSGTYARIDTGAASAVGQALGGGLGSKASVTVRSPGDKVRAVQNIASKGHLEFDISGKISTHVDVDFATPRQGQLEVLIDSPLLPKLPVKNRLTGDGGKKSNWSAVTNLGDGSVVYANSMTGETQKDAPADIF